MTSRHRLVRVAPALAIVFLIVSGCSRAEPATSATAIDVSDHRYLALGDSYTIGEGVAPQLRWPVQLVNLLRANEIKIEVPRIQSRRTRFRGGPGRALRLSHGG